LMRILLAGANGQVGFELAGTLAALGELPRRERHIEARLRR